MYGGILGGFFGGGGLFFENVKSDNLNEFPVLYLYTHLTSLVFVVLVSCLPPGKFKFHNMTLVSHFES